MTQARFDTITREDLAQRLSRQKPDSQSRRGSYALVNVLKPEAFAEERIPGSINIPQGREQDFEGGLKDWKAGGKPVEKEPQHA